MSNDKKENTKSLSGFGFNVDSENSNFTEIPTITNLLGRKKFQKKDLPAPKKTEVEAEEKTTPTLKAIELTDPPKEAFHFKTSTGFNTYQPKEGSISKVERKKIHKKRTQITPLSVLKAQEFIDLGATTVLYMKKNEQGHFTPHAYHGTPHLKNTWAGMELKKTIFPEFFQFAEIESTPKSLQTLHSYKSIQSCFTLHAKQFHFFIPDFNSQKTSFFILSAEKDIEKELKNFFSQSTSKRAA